MEVQKDMKCIAPEYSICSKCKNNDTELCLDCTTYYNNCAIYLCGVVVGFEQHFWHHNFEQKEAENGTVKMSE